MDSINLFQLFQNQMCGYLDSLAKYKKVIEEIDNLYEKEFNEIDQKYSSDTDDENEKRRLRVRKNNEKSKIRQERFNQIINDANYNFNIDDLKRLSRFVPNNINSFSLEIAEKIKELLPYEEINQEIIKVDYNGFGQSRYPTKYPWIAIFNTSITKSTSGTKPYITIFLNSEEKENVLYIGLCIGGNKEVQSNQEAFNIIGEDYSKVFEGQLYKGLFDNEIKKSFVKKFTDTFVYYCKIEMTDTNFKDFEDEFINKLKIMISVYDHYAANANKKEYKQIWTKNPNLKKKTLIPTTNQY